MELEISQKERNVLARIRKSIDEKDKGFTLVELLVVVIIIGILAAIAIPVYLNQQNKAKDSAAKSDLANAKTALVAYMVEQATLPATAPTFTTVGFTPTEGTTGLSIADWDVTSDPATFCIEITSAASNTFHTTSSGGITDAGC